MSMQLDALNAGSFGELANFCWIRIDENADSASSRWECVHNSAGDGRLDVARARRVKIKSDHVRAEFDAPASIIRVCYTADFDLYWVHERKLRSSNDGALINDEARMIRSRSLAMQQ